MYANQTAVVQPRLKLSQLPYGLKYSSSSSATPILSLWANQSGISSTRSVVTLNCSVMQTAYRNFPILSLFERTMSCYISPTWFGYTDILALPTQSNTFLSVRANLVIQSSELLFYDQRL